MQQSTQLKKKRIWIRSELLEALPRKRNECEIQSALKQGNHDSHNSKCCIWYLVKQNGDVKVTVKVVSAVSGVVPIQDLKCPDTSSSGVAVAP